MLAAAGILATLDDVRAFGRQPDFAAYYLAARAHAAGRSMYSDAARLELAQSLELPAGAYSGSTWYLYPPIFAVALRPIASLAYAQAAAIWLALNAAITAGVLYWLLRLFRWRRTHAILGALAALLLPPTQQMLLHGQINWLPLAAVALCIRDWSRAGGWRGNALLGVASAVKIFPALAAAAAPPGRRSRAWTAAALALFGVVALSWATAGGAELHDWLRALTEHAARTFSSDGSNQGLAAAIARFVQTSRGSGSMLATASAVPILLASAGVVLVTCRRAPRRVDAALRIGTVLAGTLLALPLGWDHYHVLLIPSAIVLLLGARRSPAAWCLFLTGALLLLAHRFWRPLFALLPYPVFQALGAAGALCWWIAGMWLLVRGTKAGALERVPACAGAGARRT